MERSQRGGLAELQLCTALFAHAACSEVPTPATVYRLLQLGPRDLLEPLRSSRSESARTCAALLADQKPEARAGIVLGVVNKLAFMEDPVIRRFTSAGSRPPDFESLTEFPTAAYWVVHEQDAALLQPLSAVFFTLLLFELSRGGSGDVPVTLLLDELANIGRIPHFPTVISVARGEIPFVSDVSFTEHQSQRRLLTADEVRRIGTDQSLLIISNLAPILAKRPRWDRPPRPGNAPRLGPEHAMTPLRPKARPNGPANTVMHLRDKLNELEDD